MHRTKPITSIGSLGFRRAKTGAQIIATVRLQRAQIGVLRGPLSSNRLRMSRMVAAITDTRVLPQISDRRLVPTPGFNSAFRQIDGAAVFKTILSATGSRHFHHGPAPPTALSRGRKPRGTQAGVSADDAPSPGLNALPTTFDLRRTLRSVAKVASRSARAFLRGSSSCIAFWSDRHICLLFTLLLSFFHSAISRSKVAIFRASDFAPFLSL